LVNLYLLVSVTLSSSRACTRGALLTLTPSSGASVGKSLSARLCVTLLFSRLHQRRTRVCTRGALTRTPAPEAHSSRLHQRRTSRACTRGALAPVPEAYSRLYQRRTPLACTRGALLQRRTPRAYASGAPHLSRLHEVTHLHWCRACTGGVSLDLDQRFNE
jgi:hypothetical protein